MFFIIPVPRGAANCYAMFFMLGIVLFLPASAIFYASNTIYKEYKMESYFRQQYGADWKEQYDEQLGEGALQRSRSKMMMGAVAVPVVGTIIGLLIWQIRGRNGGSSHGRRRRKSRQKNQW